MLEVAFQQSPHARLELLVAVLAVTLPQPAEYPQNARVALRCEYPIGALEAVVGVGAIAIPIDHFALELRRNVAAGVLQYRHQVIGGMTGQRVLEIE